MGKACIFIGRKAFTASFEDWPKPFSKTGHRGRGPLTQLRVTRPWSMALLVCFPKIPRSPATTDRRDAPEKIISLSFRSIYPLSSIAIRFNFALNTFIPSSSQYFFQKKRKKEEGKIPSHFYFDRCLAVHKTETIKIEHLQISILQSPCYKYHSISRCCFRVVRVSFEYRFL